ncbi:MAG: OmpA family protein, partial [SAR324 cluster bacterium]|nr:OmpA family protein [SAR324 cluster bacterium]
FIFNGQSSNLDKASRELEQLEVPDDVSINASKAGVEVSFSKTVAFEQGSVTLSEKAKGAVIKMLPIIGQLQNNIEISGHTDESDSNQKYPSNWELSVARASVIAAFLESKLIPSDRIQVAGYGDSRPRFNPDTAYKRSLNRRVQIVLMPEDQTR